MNKIESASIWGEIPEMQNEVKMSFKLDGVELSVKEDGCKLNPVFINFIKILKMSGKQFENKYGKTIGFQYRSIKKLAVRIVGGLIDKARREENILND